jgi:hypothetical protein
MVYLSTILASMSDVQRQTYYLDCAKAALADYDLGALTIHFVQHNAGIVYCLKDNDGAKRFLLKIHESAGDGLVDTPARLRAQMAWLQALTDDGRVIVQSPVVNRQAEYVLSLRSGCVALP